MARLNIKKPTSMETKRPKVYCKDFIPLQESAPHTIFAGGGTGKSYLSIKIAMTFVAENPNKKALLWLTEDAEGETRHRYESLLSEFGYTRSFFDDRIDFISDSPVPFCKMVKGNPEVNPEFNDIKEDLIPYSLVVIDPLLQFYGLEENNNTHAGVFMGLAKDWCAKENKILLMLHHASWNAQTQRLKARGAGELVNSTRGTYELQRIYTTDQDGNIVKDHSKDQYLRAVLTKENGLGYWFRNETGDMVRDIKVFPSFKKDIEPTIEAEFKSDDNVLVSISKDITKDFKATKVPFSKLKDLMSSEFNYSCQLFKDGYRDLEHYVSGSNLIALDIDDGMTLNEARALFEPYKNIIATTKSHQKDKNGKVCDRFRVILKCDKPITLDAEEFKNMMMEVHQEYSFVDKQCSNVSRFYYPSKGSQVFINDGFCEFDWEPYHKRAIARKEIQQNKREQIANQSFSETTDEDVINALEFIPSDCGYEEWINIGMALHSQLGESGFDVWNRWSANSVKYEGEHNLQSHWKSFGKRNGVGVGTLFHYAKLNGYRKLEMPMGLRNENIV